MQNFKHLRKGVLKKMIFLLFPLHFYGSNPGPFGPGHFEPLDIYWNKLGKGLRGNATYQIPNFKHLSRVALKKKILNIFYVFQCFKGHM